MSVKKLRDASVIVNDSLHIDHGVLYMGVGPNVQLTDLEEEDCTVHISTKQEAEQVIKACQSFLDNIDMWDWVAKDKEDDDEQK